MMRFKNRMNPAGAVPFGEVRDHVARRDVECGVEVGDTVAAIVVRAPLGHAGHERQHQGGAIQRLDLGLLVHAQHDRRIGWVQVEPDDVAHLVDELWIR